MNTLNPSEGSSFTGLEYSKSLGCRTLTPEELINQALMYGVIERTPSDPNRFQKRQPSPKPVSELNRR